eukprot:gene11515-biopygen19891
MWTPLAERQRSEIPHRPLAAATWEGRPDRHFSPSARFSGKQPGLSPMVSVWTASSGKMVRAAPQRHLSLPASVACPRAWSTFYDPNGGNE